MERQHARTSKPKRQEAVSDREMTTALFLLRCVQIGLSMQDLDCMTVGLVNDMFVELHEDSEEHDLLAQQEDFDKF